jgi:hypothetical protein
VKLHLILEGIYDKVGDMVRIAVTASDRPGGVGAEETDVTL